MMKRSKLLAAAALCAALSTPVLAQTAPPATAGASAPTASTAGSATGAPASAAAPAAGAPGTTAAAPAAGGQLMPSGDILQTLRSNGQFTTLVKAVDATNLTAVLKSAGPLTIFAPTDAAFAALPPGQLDTLMNAKPPADLQKLVLYHVVNARVDESKIKGAKGPIPSVATTPVNIDGSTEPYKVNDATIVQTVPVSNGIIYVVDKVLSPTFTPEAAPAAQ